MPQTEKGTNKSTDNLIEKEVIQQNREHQIRKTNPSPNPNHHLEARYHSSLGSPKQSPIVTAITN